MQSLSVSSIRLAARTACVFVLMVALSWGNSESATTPDPDLSIIPAVITLSPDGTIEYKVTVIGQLGPVAGEAVTLSFFPDGASLVAWCVDETPPNLSAATNANGEASFFVKGAGCITKENFTGAGGGDFIAQVSFAGQFINGLEINSPDVVNRHGALPTTDDVDHLASGGGTGNNCNPSTGTTEVGLADAVFHTVPFQLGTIEKCSNFTGPDFEDNVGLGDAVFATTYIQNGVSCTCQ